MITVLICLAGGLGAGLRFVVDGMINSVTRGRLPLGTMVINIVGSLMLGAITGTTWPSPTWPAVLGVGVCGGFTTFSAASLEAARLLAGGRARAGVLVAAVMLALCLIAASVGFSLAHALSG